MCGIGEFLAWRTQDRHAGGAYIFGAICPKDGKGAAVVLPRCNIAAMNLIGRGGPLIVRGRGSRTAFGPAPGDLVLLSDAGLVGSGALATTRADRVRNMVMELLADAGYWITVHTGCLLGLS